MARPEVIGAVRSTCESIVERRGLELVDLSFLGEGGARILRVVVDRVDGGVPVDEIAEVSEEISRALDLEDPIQGRYLLEVSSAGLERPLVKPGDYLRFSGREVKVRTHDPIEGRRNFKGTIRSSNDQTFVLASNEGLVFEIPFTSVAKANLVVNWDEALKGGKL